MKKTIILLITVASFLSVKAQKDTSFTDSTLYISNNQINKYLSTIYDKVSAKQYSEFIQMLKELITQSKKEWEEENKPKK